MEQDAIFNEMIVKSALKYRRIALIEEFTRESCYKVMYYMNKIRENDNKINLPLENRIIQIDISSYGGCAYSCLGLISLIESFKEEGYIIVTNVMSMAMSAGFFTSIVGSKRKMSRYGVLMMHQVIGGTYGELQKQIEDVVECNRIWSQLKELVIKYTDYTEQELEELKKCKLDLYIDAETAIKKRCVDEII